MKLIRAMGGNADSAPTTRLPTAAVRDRFVSIHLDLKDWVDLSRARLRRPDGVRFQDAYKYLQASVADGSVRVTLSGPLYVEIAMQIPDVRRRTHLADVMSEISRFNTINARHVLLESEIEDALHQRLGRPAFPRKVESFGRGAFFAFTGRVHTARLEDAGSGTIEKLAVKDPINTLKLLVYGNEVMEWGLLRGPSEGLLPQIDLTPLRKMDEGRLDLDRELKEMLRNSAKLRLNRSQVVLLRELRNELGPEFARVLRKANMSIDSFTRKGLDWVNDFLNDLPIIAVQACLREKNHANASRDWKPNDLRDFEQLSIAVPYCDVVVTEKHSATILKNAKAEARHQTRILFNTTQLPQVLEDMKR